MKHRLSAIIIVLAIAILTGCSISGSADNALPSWLQNTSWSGVMTVSGTSRVDGESKTVSTPMPMAVSFSDTDVVLPGGILSSGAASVDIGIDGSGGLKADLDRQGIKYTESRSDTSYVINIPSISLNESQAGTSASMTGSMKLTMTKQSETTASLEITPNVSMTMSSETVTHTYAIDMTISGTLTKQ